MTDEIEVPVADSEPQETQATETEMASEENESGQESRTVPLAALESERAKRKEREYEAREAQRKLELYQKHMEQMQKQQPANDDDDYSEYEEPRPAPRVDVKASIQAEIENEWAETFPERMKAISEHLPKILQQRPSLKHCIAESENRGKEMWAILQDYKHLIEDSEKLSENHKRMEENAKKPGNVNTVGKPAKQSKLELLRDYSGKKGWREIRAKMRRGEL